MSTYSATSAEKSLPYSSDFDANSPLQQSPSHHCEQHNVNLLSEQDLQDRPTQLNHFHQGSGATTRTLPLSRAEQQAQIRQAFRQTDPKVAPPIKSTALSAPAEIQARTNLFMTQNRDRIVQKSISNITAVFKGVELTNQSIRIKWHQISIKFLRLSAYTPADTESNQAGIRTRKGHDAVVEIQDILANKLLDALVIFNQSNDFSTFYSTVCESLVRLCGYQTFEVEQHFFDCFTEQLKHISCPSYVESQLLTNANEAYSALDCKDMTMRLNDVKMEVNNQITLLIPIVGCLQKAGLSNVTSEQSLDDLTEALIHFLPTNLTLSLDKAKAMLSPSLRDTGISDKDTMIFMFQELIFAKYEELYLINHNPEHTSAKILDFGSPGPIGLLLFTIKYVIELEGMEVDKTHSAAAILNALAHVAVKNPEFKLLDQITELSLKIMHEPQLQDKGFSKLTLMSILQRDLLSTSTPVVRLHFCSGKQTDHQSIATPTSTQRLDTCPVFNSFKPRIQDYEYKSRVINKQYPELMDVIKQDPCAVLDALRPLNLFPDCLGEALSNEYVSRRNKASKLLDAINDSLGPKPWNNITKIIEAFEKYKDKPLFNELYKILVTQTNDLPR
ncbi:MAG: hypothetical protein HAW66_00525 [Shewanella sp.]|nr:hypothetical protein [Shewanella sp.]